LGGKRPQDQVENGHGDTGEEKLPVRLGPGHGGAEAAQDLTGGAEERVKEGQGFAQETLLRATFGLGDAGDQISQAASCSRALGRQVFPMLPKPKGRASFANSTWAGCVLVPPSQSATTHHTTKW